MSAEFASHPEFASPEQIYVLGNLIALREATLGGAGGSSEAIPEPSGQPLDSSLQDNVPGFVSAQFPPVEDSHTWNHLVSVRYPANPTLVIPEGLMEVEAILDFQRRTVGGVWHCKYQIGRGPVSGEQTTRFLSKTVVRTMSRAIPSPDDQVQASSRATPAERRYLRANIIMFRHEAEELLDYLRGQTTTGTETVTIPDFLPTDFA